MEMFCQFSFSFDPSLVIISQQVNDRVRLDDVKDPLHPDLIIDTKGKIGRARN